MLNIHTEDGRMFTTYRRMFLFLSVVYLMSITGVHLQSNVGFKDETIFRSSTPYSNSTPDHNITPSSISTAVESTTPYSYSTSDHNTMPSSIITAVERTTPYSNSTPDHNITPSPIITADESTKPYSISTPDHNITPSSSISTAVESTTPYSISSSISTAVESTTPYSISTPYSTSLPVNKSTLSAASKPNDMSTLSSISSSDFTTSTPYSTSSPYSFSTFSIFRGIMINNLNMTEIYDYFDEVQDYLDDYFFNNTGELTPVIDEALKLCPHMQFCTIAGALQNTSDIRGQDETIGNVGGSNSTMPRLSSNCCTGCSCSSSCHAAENCCADALVYSKSNRNYKSRCRSVVHTSHSNQQISFVSDLEKIAYSTIVDCNTNGQLSQEKSLFDDVARVSVGNKLYLSKSCALSQGETNIVRWRLIATDCENDLYALPLHGSEFETYVLKYCTVFSIPPDNLDIVPFLCPRRDRVIDVCNVTGLWDYWMYRWYVDTLCIELMEHHVYDEDGNIYRNIFCLMCNKPRGYTLPQTCPSIRQPEVPELPELGRSYELLLDTNADDTRSGQSNIIYDDNNDNNNNCNSILVFDQFEGNCRELLCPFQRIPNMGKCERGPFEARNRVFPVMLKIELLVSFSVDNLESSKNTMLSQLFQELNLTSNSNVILQNISLTAFASQETNNVTFLSLALNVRSSEIVDDDWIIHFLDHVTHSADTNVDIGNITAPVKMSYMTKDVMERKNGEEDNNLLMETLLLRNEITCSDCYMVSIGKLTCPYIRLEKGDYCRVLEKYDVAELAECLSTEVDGGFTVEREVKNGGDVTDVLYMCWVDYKRWTEQWKVETYDMSVSVMNQPLSTVIVFLAVACKQFLEYFNE